MEILVMTKIAHYTQSNPPRRDIWVRARVVARREEPAEVEIVQQWICRWRTAIRLILSHSGTRFETFDLVVPGKSLEELPAAVVLRTVPIKG